MELLYGRERVARQLELPVLSGDRGGDREVYGCV